MSDDPTTQASPATTAPGRAPDPHDPGETVGRHAGEDHGGDHGHDDHGHDDARLGPPNWAAWGAGLLGLALGLVVIGAIVSSVGLPG